MTEREDFLTRWSRRKREASADPAVESERDHAAAPNAAGNEPKAQEPPAQSEDAKREDIFDLSKLPSLESIGPATDVRAFLQPGVPEALSRAALRRAWSADPVIRDFIGLAENSWDFTANDAMPGFGALDPEVAKRLFAELIGQGEKKTAATEVAGLQTQDAPGDEKSQQESVRQSIHACETSTPAADVHSAVDEGADISERGLTDSGRGPTDVAPQDNGAPQQNQPSLTRRHHGRALPQ
ncbi:DUF3306 domain-containing protein [Pseudorhodoplanes sp.]|uniref:DUF3306 domain-containing protein n=1 Tax=Pseudorhodoplanes sp. TaxID=1934341 RepID=UPI002B6B68BC|nr:DUF3306 domain-containing protein [Pseudorhodoplanes sp.]HWV52129.1 DUF3306 domain-containing protein [Pseudorhodoplanes sp.]